MITTQKVYTPKIVRVANGTNLALFGMTGKSMRERGVVFIPSDPNALLEKLDLLLASQEASHTGVRNEMVNICDELKRQGVLDPKPYKKVNL